MAIDQQVSLDDLCVNTIRTLSIDAVQQANSGHPGMPLGAAPAAYMLWQHFLKFNPKDPGWPDRDRFVLSAGHASMLLYSLLHLYGYDLSLDEIKHFRQWESITPGHPEHGLTPGVETTTGPLGQGISNAVGMAIAEAHLAAVFNRPGHEIVNHYTYCFASDGDMMEGISHEACALAGHLRLRKLIVVYDDNKVMLSGPTSDAMDEDVGSRFEAYGWYVQRIDGNDRKEVENALNNATQERERPSLIVSRTHIGFASPLQDSYKSHGSPLGADNVKATKKNLGWQWDEPFYIPPQTVEHFHEASQRGEMMQQDWQQRFSAYAQAFPELAAQWTTMMSGALPEGYDSAIPTWSPADNKGEMSTRVASGKVINAVAPKLPALMGGSADLATSNETLIEGEGLFSATDHVGRNMNFGVREHGMGGILNGMAVHGGFIPYGGTFLTFSDYMRGAIRLAALMGQRVIYVFTHDSIGLGEDGPTHQPIEQLAALRAIPGLTVIRPADANETAYAWRAALANSHGPTAFSLTRQNLPILDQTKVAPASNLERGGYILSEAQGGAPEVILIATGSEVSLCLQAQQQLATKGTRARVVSMPCTEFFDKQPQQYRDTVLPPSITKRLAVETAVPMTWYKYVGLDGDVLGLTHYGASAPYKTLFEQFGFTPENITARALSLLGRS